MAAAAMAASPIATLELRTTSPATKRPSVELCGCLSVGRHPSCFGPSRSIRLPISAQINSTKRSPSALRSRTYLSSIVIDITGCCTDMIPAASAHCRSVAARPNGERNDSRLYRRCINIAPRLSNRIQVRPLNRNRYHLGDHRWRRDG